MACKKYGKAIAGRERICSQCQISGKKLFYKRPFWIMGALTVMLSMSGCVGVEDPTENEVMETNDSEKDVEAKTPPLEEELAYVRQTDGSLSVSELEEQAIYRSDLTSEGEQVKLYILPAKEGETFMIQSGEDSFAGQEGEELYKGGLTFYLADSKGKEGYLQEFENRDYLLNLSKEPFERHILGDQAILQLSESQSMTAEELSLWAVQSGALITVSIGGEPVIPTSTSEMKPVDDRYIQTYEYVNTEPNGWVFRTYEWNPEKAEMTVYDETALLIEGPFYYESMEEEEREYYQSIIDNWHRISDYTYPFPHLNYPENLQERLENGYVLDEQAPIGSSLVNYLERKPEHLGEYDAEGSWFYAYPDGQSVYFDKGVDTIQAIQLSGGNYMETVSELKTILGDPISDSKDDPPSEEDEWLEGTNYDVGDILFYEFGDYQVNVMHEDERVDSILLNKRIN